MFAARDQENLVANHQALAAAKPLNQTQNRLAPKTPGNRYPKTPIRMPLNDENIATGFGKGKSLLQTKGKGAENMPTGKKTFDKNAFITPMGPQANRAPLGQKTTNAKARAFATPAAETQLRPTSMRPQRQKIKHNNVNKLEIHGDSPLLSNGDDVPEPEYCPPRVPEEPYVNDDIDVSDLDYTIVHREAQSRDFYFKYHGKDIAEQERRMEERKLADWKKADEMIERMVQEDVLILSDSDSEVERKKRAERVAKAGAKPSHSRTASNVRQPLQRANTTGLGTLNARRAASALSIAPRTTTTAANSSIPSRMTSHTRSVSSGAPLKKAIPFGLRKATAPAPTTSTLNNYSIRAATAAAASRSTIGYTKGRSAARSVLTGAFEPTTTSAPATHSRAPSVASTTSSFGRPASRSVASNASAGSVNTTTATRPRLGMHRATSSISARSHISTASIGSESDNYSTITPAKFARKMAGAGLQTIHGSPIASISGTEKQRPGIGERRISLQDAFENGSDEEGGEGEKRDTVSGVIPLGGLSLQELLRCDSDEEGFQMTPIFRD